MCTNKKGTNLKKNGYYVTIECDHQSLYTECLMSQPSECSSYIPQHNKTYVQ